MGGTFNPIHYGHLILAEEARVTLALDEVLFIPNHLPPHRAADSPVAAAEQRYLMAEMATASHPHFRCSRVELDRPAPSYSVDTVHALRDRHPDWSLTFLTGADSIMKYVWKDLDRLLGGLEAMVVATRPGYSLDSLRERMDAMGLLNRSRMQTLEIPGVAISGTEIRRRVAAGRSIRYLVPEAVEQYIVKTRLYQALEAE